MGGDVMVVVKLYEPWWGSHYDERDKPSLLLTVGCTGRQRIIITCLEHPIF
jgi:hypothetical protein